MTDSEIGTPESEVGKKYIDDLDRVGINKPMAYLPLSTLRENNHQDPAIIIENMREKGFYAEILVKDEPSSHISEGGWLFVADLDSLSKLLEKNASLIEEYGWPTDPIKFIKRTTVRGSAYPKTKLFDLIADAYGDFNNANRTDIDGETE